ncbi:MAG TPA: ATP-dependent protease ATPase subunit HslU [Firmicutes bacterium]|nr:ATP-dependent protease ATPase subunit HslU [Bacillota bacterium]
MDKELTPKEIVAELDKYIVGQDKAKRSVAIALRNRYRRQQLSQEMMEEIIPKNIIMIGPTGVGKTEIARRLARLVDAPFVKVEATKFTEVGYVGRDVESIIRELAEASVRMVKNKKMEEVKDRAYNLMEERLLDLLMPFPRKKKDKTSPLSLFFPQGEQETPPSDEADFELRYNRVLEERQKLLARLRAGELEDRLVEIEVEEKPGMMMEIFPGQNLEEMGMNFNEILGGLLPKKKKKRKMTVAQARVIIQMQEAQKLIDMDEVTREAIYRAENSGIVFIDEIDKIAGKGYTSGPDVSREGVQRDILPIVEGSTIMTKYGPVKTDYMLFVAAGAFHVSSPSDLIPELQGRFPIRVELDSLNEKDFVKILTEPQNALIKQYASLLRVDGIDITFTDDGIMEIARTARILNENMENIGARRLHTILEKVLEDVSFDAPDIEGKKVIINQEYVKNKLVDIIENKDLSKFIL